MATKRGQKSGLEAAASNGRPPATTPANAWARPLQQTTTRTSPSPPPGMGPADKVNAANGATIPTIHRERLLHLSLTLVGQKVVVTQTNGAVLEGIFHTFTPFSGLAPDMKNKYVLNAVKTVKKPESGDYSVKDGSTLIIPVEKVMYILAKGINLERPVANGGPSFGPNAKNDVITDTQIAGGRTRKHELVAAGTAWTNTGGKTRAEAMAGALDEKSGDMTRKGTGGNSRLQGNIGEWDQFKANQELFNVNATFDENLYTTELDKSQMDGRKIARAERIAREIETTTSSNIHVAEERGHVVETDLDEEDRYSGVLTKDGKQRHTASSKDSKEKPKSTEPAAPAPTAPKKIMNYAAAAAKADASKKAAPPGFGAKASASTPESKPAEKPTQVTPDEKKVKDNEEKPKPAEESKPDEEKKDAPKEEKAKEEPAKEAKPDVKEKEDPKKEANDNKAESDEKKADKSGEKDKKEEAKEEAPSKSKLNANAKSFSFNPSAKTFTPTFGQNTSFSTPDTQQQPQHAADPNAGMQMHGAHPMQPPHYMHAAPMGQPGMMPMMSPQYQGMRYPPQYQGMDQHAAQAQMQQPHQPQHVQAPGAPAPAQSTAPAPSPTGTAASGEEESTQPQPQEGDASQQPAPQQQPQEQQQPQPPQQQQMPMQYNGPPPNAYYASGGMAMHQQRGPGGYPPQFAPQQMRVGPGGAPYGHMYQMQPSGMPPNMHMRGPGGAPYYPGPGGQGGPMPSYPQNAYHGHGMMDDNDPQFRGRGRGGQTARGRGRRGGRGRAGGRGGGYQQNYGGQNSGRSTPQQPVAGGESGGATEGPPQNAETKKPETSNTNATSS